MWGRAVGGVAPSHPVYEDDERLIDYAGRDQTSTAGPAVPVSLAVPSALTAATGDAASVWSRWSREFRRQTNGLPWMLLAVYFLNAAVETVPMTAFTGELRWSHRVGPLPRLWVPT